MNRRSFLVTLLAAPLALRAKTNPFIHPWVYKPTQAQRDFISSELPRVLYGGAAGPGKSLMIYDPDLILKQMKSLAEWKNDNIRRTV